jgi:hypothetical protein
VHYVAINCILEPVGSAGRTNQHLISDLWFDLCTLEHSRICAMLVLIVRILILLKVARFNTPLPLTGRGGGLGKVVNPIAPPLGLHAVDHNISL